MKIGGEPGRKQYSGASTLKKPTIFLLFRGPPQSASDVNAPLILWPGTKDCKTVSKSLRYLLRLNGNYPISLGFIIVISCDTWNVRIRLFSRKNFTTLFSTRRKILLGVAIKIFESIEIL